MLAGKEPILKRRRRQGTRHRKSADGPAAVRAVGAQAQHAAEISLAAARLHRGGRNAVDLGVLQRAAAHIETDNAADKGARLSTALEVVPHDRSRVVDRAEIDACDAAQREIGARRGHDRAQRFASRVVVVDGVHRAVVDADDVAVGGIARDAGYVRPFAPSDLTEHHVVDDAVVDRDEVAVGVEGLSAGRDLRARAGDGIGRSHGQAVTLAVQSFPRREDAAARRRKRAGDGVVRVQDHRVGVCIAETAARVDAEERVDGSGVGQGRASQCVTIFQIDVAARAVDRQTQQMTVAEIVAVDVVGTLVTCARSAGIALELIDIVRSAVKVGNTVEINVLQKSGIRHTIHDFAAPNIRRRRPLGEDISVVSSLDLPVKARSRSVDGLDIVVAAVTVTEQRHGSIPRCGVDVYGVLTFISVAECVKRPRIVVPPARTEIGVVDVDVVCKRSVGRGSAETSADNTDIGAHGIPCLTLDGPSKVGYHACCSICRIRFGSK